MRENAVKAALAAGGTSLGTMVFEFDTTGIARIAPAAGAEFVIFDMEHTGWSIETIRMLIATIARRRHRAAGARAGDAVSLPRAAARRRGDGDHGADGRDRGAGPADRAARRKYPPDGRRGAAFGVAHDDYGRSRRPSRRWPAPTSEVLIDRPDRDGGGRRERRADRRGRRDRRALDRPHRPDQLDGHPRPVRRTPTTWRRSSACWPPAGATTSPSGSCRAVSRTRAPPLAQGFRIIAYAATSGSMGRRSGKGCRRSRRSPDQLKELTACATREARAVSFCLATAASGWLQSCAVRRDSALGLGAERRYSASTSA